MRPTWAGRSRDCGAAAPRGKKLLVGIAVERHPPRGLGRCRMAVLPDATTDTLRLFLADHVEEGATVITDGWQPYRQATAGRYVHRRQPVAGREATTTLPGVHRVASLAKRWLLGTHQGSADDAPCPATSTSLSSAATAAAHAVVGSSSTASCSSPSLISRCAIATWY